MSDAELPIGQRIAQLRMRRGMTQQVLADRLGRSKSWVDKVEARRAEARPAFDDPGGRRSPRRRPGGPARPKAQREPVPGVDASVDRMRATLACYDTDPSGVEARRELPSTQGP